MNVEGTKVALILIDTEKNPKKDQGRLDTTIIPFDGLHLKMEEYCCQIHMTYNSVIVFER